MPPLQADPSFRLHAFFSQGHRPTLQEIQEHLDLSERQVRRIIRSMREDEGLPVAEERDGRLKRFFLPPEHWLVSASQGLDLEEREAFALTVAAQAARSALAPTPLGEPLRRAFEKLLASLPVDIASFEPEYEASHWYFDNTTAINIDPSVFEALTRAITACEVVHIDYFSASRHQSYVHRPIEPYLVAARGSSWLLVAYCRAEQGFVDFSLPAITKVEPSGEHFTRRADFDPELHFRDRFSVLQGDDVYVVRLAVEAEKAPYFQRKTYHPTQQVEAERGDGSMIVSFEVSGLDEIAAFIRSWGPGVRVLEPEALRQRLAAQARAVAAAYEAGA